LRSADSTPRLERPEMRSLDELRTFYESQLSAELAVLEKQRKKCLNTAVMGIAVGAGVFLFSLLLTLATGIPPILIGGVIVAVIVAAAVSSIGSRDYKHSFKASVIRPLVRFVDPSLAYNPDAFIPEETFIRGRMFAIKPDRYSGDDLVTGRLGLTEVAFSEVHAEYKTTTHTKHGTQTHWHTIFKGLLFLADFNKDFRGTTVVSPDLAERLLGKWGQKLQGLNFLSDLQLVKLEDPEFEKLFVVHSQDQIEARYVLSTSLMERITRFRNKTQKDMSLSFVGSKVFVAIAHSEDMFEPRLFHTLIDFDTIRDYFDDIALAVGIVEDLNLNTRIWSKS